VTHTLSDAYRALIAAVLAVAFTAHVPPALAQEARDPGEPTAYRSTVREALSEYHAKNFQEARRLFEDAHRLYPNARTLRGLGMTAYELRSYRESVSFLKSALEAQAKPLEGNLRIETEKLLSRAERFVGKLTIQVTPADANVMIDNDPVVLGPEPVVLEIGDHTFEFHAEGYLPESRSLYVKGRENETWTVVLNKVPAPVVAAPVVPPPEEVARQAEPIEPARGTRFVNLDATSERRSDRPLYKNPWLWTGVAVVIVAAVVIPVVVMSRDDKLAAPQVNGANTPNDGIFSALGGRP
jgi:hypothetical protein